MLCRRGEAVTIRRAEAGIGVQGFLLAREDLGPAFEICVEVG